MQTHSFNMDSSIKNCKEKNPVESANYLSQLFYLYMFPVFHKALKNNLKDELYKPLKTHKSSILGDKLEEILKEEQKKKKKFSLLNALMKHFGLYFWVLGLIKLVEEVILVVIPPIAIGRLIAFFEKETLHSEKDAYIAGGTIIFVLLFKALSSTSTMMALDHITMKLRVTCSTLIYRKALRLSQTSLSMTSVGQLVNFLSNDVNKFESGFVLFHYIWIAPIQVAIGTYLIYKELGVSTFVGILFLLSFMPLQIYLGKKASSLRLITALRTDKRVQLMNEIISGIQVIKMYCWERSFAKFVSIARRKEMSAIRSHAYMVGMNKSFDSFATRTAIFISILMYVLFGNVISARKIFAITAIYGVIRTPITNLFFIGISTTAEVYVTIQRIQKFLSLDEYDCTSHQDGKSQVVKPCKKNKPFNHEIISSKPMLDLKNVAAKWTSNSEICLENLNLNINSNSLVAIVGLVGSGKSSLLNLLLNEMVITEGTIIIEGNISYASQEPWLFEGSIRHNILFGNRYNPNRYNDVVRACALDLDFKLFPFGDKTLVRERGKNLSGGQKARINLARCIYAQADIYLLDDPLSAVDANVGKHLYEYCIQHFLKDKICILVTHQLHYLRNTDLIIIMNEGKIQNKDTFQELESSDSNFAKMVKKLTSDGEETIVTALHQNPTDGNNVIHESDNQNIDEEHAKTGKVPLSVYLKYIKFGGGYFMLILLVSTFLVAYAFGYGGDYFVAYWVNLEQNINSSKSNPGNNSDLNTTNSVNFNRTYIVYTYTFLTLGTILFAIIHIVSYFGYLVRVSINMHDRTFERLLRVTMSFFDNNPSGRILNRFSKDMGLIDEFLPFVFYDVLNVGFMLISIIVLSTIVEPFLLLPFLVLIIIFNFCRIIYIQTGRSVKRLESIRKSPLLSHLTATMEGLTTIRAARAQNSLIKEFDCLQDAHSSAWYLFIASNHCFGLWLDIIATCFIATAIILLIHFKNDVREGDVGMIIIQYIQMTGVLQWGMRQWGQLENVMVSVERIIEYTKLEKEPLRKKINLPAQWPQNGKIEFKNINLRYKPSDPYVLRNLVFDVQPGEKIGIVGRTGAGKSSTISALFQLYDLEGSIIIDDVDIMKIPLEEARSKISIIPQEPVLFSGTLRHNLDPFEEFSDEAIWNALEQVELREFIVDLKAGLNSEMSEKGSNFSIGQRQLVCLARALIRNNKILVLDEATGNVDFQTDTLIQRTIREKFVDCTVLTIAHRLYTVMDSDKILVIDDGQIQEFDHPYVLLQNKNGALYKLVQAIGNNASSALYQTAEKEFRKIQAATFSKR